MYSSIAPLFCGNLNCKIVELNFNSVEMSSKPNAEASSLDYAKAPLTFNSVETILVLNASAAFKTDSGKVFKEDEYIEHEV